MRWIVLSIALSVTLTVLLNVALRLFPGLADRAARRLTEVGTHDLDSLQVGERRLRVFVPWKAMILVSVLLTILLNLLLWMA